MKSLLKSTRAAGACIMLSMMWAVVSVQAQVYEVIPEGVSLDEPSMAEYTHYPLFQTGSIAPRIMVVLDNSGSMNFPAYNEAGVEEYPYGNEITNAYKGSSCERFSTQIKSATDDGQEQKDTGQMINCDGIDLISAGDVDLGADDDIYGDSNCVKACACYPPSIAAFRFDQVYISSQIDGVPVVVKNAYIKFTARENQASNKKISQGEVTLKITAQAADNPPTLSWNNGNISSRPDTSASVTWTIPDSAWTANALYSTPDIAPIVQELLGRPGWVKGNAMLFKIDIVSGTGGRPAYSFEGNAQKSADLLIEYEPCEVRDYYGYFDPHSMYTYTGNVFVRDASGSWDGNFLNFLSMRRGDVLRKALVGGLSTARTGGGNATQIGISENTSPHADFKRHYVGGGVSPYNDAWYFISNGYIVVKDTEEWSAAAKATFKIEVEKDPDAEPNDFDDEGSLAGVFQKVGDRAEWGNAWFTQGGVDEGKGEIAYAMGQNMNNMVTTIKNTPFDTSTPIAEALYVVTQYFKMEDAEIDGYANGAIGPFNDERDPYLSKDDNETEMACASGFCLLLTDGMSSKDQVIPKYLQDYAGLGIEEFPNDGSSFARDVALYMHTTDLRSATVGRSELEDEQSITLYVVYALGNNSSARTLLQQTAKMGGFRDSNNNDFPDLTNEWDKNGDGLPDNYFEAQDGYKLEQALMNAILAILEENGSGTAVSVLATKGEGEGTLVQAIFNPATVKGEGEVKWTGMLHSLWVDDHGRIREDTDGNYSLDTTKDEHMTFSTNESGETVIKRYKDGAEEPYDDNVSLEELKAIWSAGDKLAARDPAFRKIFTYVGDGTEADPDLNRIEFNINTNFFGVRKNMNFLGVADDAMWSYLGTTEVFRTANLALWTSGVPDYDSSYYGTVNLRNRTLADGSLWKLSDIVHSTPTSMAQPLADYDLLYSDASYYDYYIKNRNRETVVFVGANSGMLHAFTGWVYDEDTFINPYDKVGYFTDYTDTTSGNVNIGDELWAYIPQSLLPHLKWLADPGYTHVNYIDLRPRIFDAKIFTPSDRNPNGWGSVLVCGMGFNAGMEIPVNPAHTDPTKRLKMYPSFFAFDVTDPRSPVLLWERSFPNLGMASNYPNLLKVEDEWLLAIGSGPTSTEGSSTQDASLIVVDLKTGGNTALGGLKNTFTLPGGDAFANEPVALDKNMNYNTDSLYVAANYNDETSRVFRLTIPQKNATEFKPWDVDGNPPEYVSDPADSSWTMTALFKSPRPITASGSISVDRKDNAWLYLGTGRYLTDTDRSSDDQNYMIGIKDPFFNPDLEDCNYTYPAKECEINTQMSADSPLNDLFDADEYKVYGRSEVEGPNGKVSFDNMLTESRRNVYQGWFRRLLRTPGSPSERIVNKGAVLGGILLKPTFTPTSDPCGYGGTSRLFAVYYETGSAFFRKVFDQDSDDGSILDVIDLGDGLASSLSIHSGRQQDGKVYVQKSTGEILEVDIDPAFNIKPGPAYWLDDGYY